LHEFLLKKLAIIKKIGYKLNMHNSSHQKLAVHLKAGRVYRRETLYAFSKAVDRDLATLANKGVLKKIAAGIYYKPASSRFGVLPPDDEDLVQCFLRDDIFLVFSWNQYNALGLGLTQLYNRLVVYNHKRHGVFKLGNKTFDFRRPVRGFPNKITPEFLLVDLVNNLDQLAEDKDFIKSQIVLNIHKFNRQKVNQCVKEYGKVATKHFFEEIDH
jgi:hypothetical protein